MAGGRARTPIVGLAPRGGILVLLLLATPALAAGPCDRYVLNELSLGMTPDMVKHRMGADGVRNLIRNADNAESSGVSYPGPPTDVYVQYDRRMDRGRARTVLVRTSMSPAPGTAQALVHRFGPPHAGAENLARGLEDGAAIWVDEACGVVLSAYRPKSDWWTGGGGALLQLETLDLARRGGSPASPQIAAILAGKKAPAPVAAASQPPAEAPKAEPPSAPPEVVVVPMEEAPVAAKRSVDGTTTDGVEPVEAPPVIANGSPQGADANGGRPPVPSAGDETVPAVDGATAAQAEPPVAVDPVPQPPPPPSIEPATAAPVPQESSPPLQETTPPAPSVPPQNPETAPPGSSAPPSPVEEPRSQRAAEVIPPPLSAQTQGTTGETKTASPQRAAEVTPPPLSKQTPGTTGQTNTASKPATIATWRTGAPKPTPPNAEKPAPQTIASWHGPSQAQPAAMPPPPSAPPPKETPRGDRPAERIASKDPVSPPTAKWLGLKGHVTLDIVVRSDGSVGSRPRVVSATPAGRGFEEAAVDAVREWRFNPATRRGVPVESKLTVVVDFP